MSRCFLFVVVLFMVSCSSNKGIPGSGGIIVDTKGVDLSTYDQDLAECREFADEVQVGGKVLTGAVAGAVVGGAIGAVVGDSRTAQQVGGVGAIKGTVQGVGGGLSERRRVVKSCLRGRGYRVLN